MSGTKGEGDARHPETMSVAQRKVIGQAIIDGILSPRQVAFINAAFDYTQTTGNYTQRGGGNYAQGGGNYNQAAMQLPTLGEQVIKVIRE